MNEGNRDQMETKNKEGLPAGIWVVHHKDHPPCLFSTEKEARESLDGSGDHVVALYVCRMEPEDG
jgi:hypothetical protein